MERHDHSPLTPKQSSDRPPLVTRARKVILEETTSKPLPQASNQCVKMTLIVQIGRSWITSLPEKTLSGVASYGRLAQSTPFVGSLVRLFRPAA